MIHASWNQCSGWQHFLKTVQNVLSFIKKKKASEMDICIQNVTRPMVCSIVKGHRDSNEVPAGKITSPLCLDRHLPMSEQVSCSRMELLHPEEDGNSMRNGNFIGF